MADEAKILQRLLLAVYAVNQAAQQPTSRWRKIKAVRGYCQVLHDVVNCGSMWQRLTDQASAATPPAHDDDAWALFTTAAEPLGAAHAKLLRFCGYAVPPPPTTDSLVADTRAYVLGENSTPKWGEQHVEEAKAHLGNFVAEVESHIKWWGKGVDAALMRCRRSGSIGLLVLVVSQGQIKTGNSFDIAFGLSLKEFVRVEITVPTPWLETGFKDLFHAMVVNSQMANLTSAIDGRVNRAAPVEVRSLDDRLPMDPGGPELLEHDGVEKPTDGTTLGLGATEVEPVSIEVEPRSADGSPRVQRSNRIPLPSDHELFHWSPTISPDAGVQPPWPPPIITPSDPNPDPNPDPPGMPPPGIGLPGPF